MAEEYSDQELDSIWDRLWAWAASFSENEYYEALTKEQQGEAQSVIFAGAIGWKSTQAVRVPCSLGAKRVAAPISMRSHSGSSMRCCCTFG